MDQLKTFSEGELDNGLMYDANLSRVLEKLLRAKANFRSVDDSDWEAPKDYSKTPTRKIDQNIDRDRNNEVNESAYKTRAWNRDRNRNRNRDWDKDAESDVSDSPFETL